MKTLFLSFLLFFNNNPSCLQMDIILLGDMSGSVQGYEGFVSSAFLTFASRFELSEENVKIGAFIFSDNPITISPLTANKPALLRDLQSINSSIASGSTFLSPSLSIAIDEFVKNGRDGYKKVIVIVSDGAVDDKILSRQTAQMMRDYGITIYSVIINDLSSNPTFMQEISDRYFDSDYQKLTETMLKMDVCL